MSILFRNKPLLWLTVDSFLTAASVSSFTLTWAPCMEVLGAEELLLGLASPIFMATTGLANYLGRRIVKLLVYKKTTIVFLVLFSSTFALL